MCGSIQTFNKFFLIHLYMHISGKILVKIRSVVYVKLLAKFMSVCLSEKETNKQTDIQPDKQTDDQ